MTFLHRMEADTRVYQKDRSQLTMKERLDAKLKREAMLKNSITSFQHVASGP